MIEIADQRLREPVAAGAPGALREAVGDEQRGAAHDQQHAERDEERGNLEPGDEPAVDEADQRGDQHRDREGGVERRRARR